MDLQAPKYLRKLNVKVICALIAPRKKNSLSHFRRRGWNYMHVSGISGLQTDYTNRFISYSSRAYTNV
jgi:hypothetical protein